MISFGFLLHAGHLAGLYLQPSPFLVPPLTAFRLIPVGYLSFLLFAVLLVWLMLRLNLTGWRAGAIFGLKLGGLRGVPSYIKKINLRLAILLPLAHFQARFGWHVFSSAAKQRLRSSPG